MSTGPENKPFSFLTRISNWISQIGVILVTTAAILWMVLLPQTARGGAANPYLGLVNVALLAGFILGLVLIPLGIRIHGQTGSLVNGGRRLALLLGITTAANLVIGSHLTYSTVEYMDSVEFCGTACHVMNPEFHAWKTGGHNGVKCVECHIAPGAQGYVEAKVNGMRQLIDFSRGTYNRPIVAESHKLPTTEEMCGRCHKEDAAHPEKLKVYSHYADDEANTRKYSVFLFHLNKVHTAHTGVQVDWKDEKKTAPNGFRKGSDQYGKASAKTVAMTCLDCHSRPAHAYESAEAAVEKAFTDGEMRPSLPFLKKQSLALLNTKYNTMPEAMKALEQLPQSVTGAGDQEVKALEAIFRRNVSPEMKLTWGTHTNQLGHMDNPGCFRCHDDAMKSNTGKAMGQDCETCHSMVVSDEASPKILSDLNWKASH